MADNSSLKEFLLKLNKNYLILKEREAKYATAAPLDLLNQIDDYEHALELAQQALEQNTPLNLLRAEFSGLNLQIDTVVFISREPPRQPFTGRNPYRGLRKFTEDEAEFFFGRTAAIESLLDTLKYLLDPQTGRESPDLITVLGPSGSGKSSLVRAGLIPALRQGRLLGSEHWLIKTMVPGPNPLDELAAQFVEPTGRGLPAVRADLNSGEKALRQLMLESLTRAGKPEEANFVLVVDQFEELFTLCEDEAERQAFLDQLLYVVRIRRNRGLVILTMRADFYGKAAAYKRLADIITLNQMLVSPMTEKELREAILLPAEAVGLELEKALVETLLNDTAKAAGVLPLLQHTLQELFHQRDGNVLTLEAYRAMGGVKGALAHRADAILDSLTESQRHIVRHIFMRLIQPAEGAVATRRRATLSEVLTQDSQTGEIEAVIQTLTGANLIVTGRSQETGEVLLDVTHEALLEEWPRFQAWLDLDRQGLRIRQQLSLAARDWENRGHDLDSLYRGTRLLEAEEWVAANPAEINPLEQSFLAASLEDRARTEARRRQRTRRIIMGLTVGLILVALGAVFGFVGQQNANIARVTAEAGQKLAQQEHTIAEARRKEAERQTEIAQAESLASVAPSLVERTHNTELAALLGVEAEHLNRLGGGSAQSFIDDSLRTILSAPYFNVVLNGQGSGVSAIAFSPVLSNSAAERFLATGSDDGAIWLWSMTDPAAEPTLLSDQEAGISSLAFSPDGLILAAGSYDGLIRLWRVADPAAPVTLLKDHQAGVRAVAFSPDGQTLASAGEDRTVRLWDVTQAIPVSTSLGEHQGSVLTVAFSPTDQILASAGEEGLIRLWDLTEPAAAPTTLPPLEGAVFSVAFSSDGQTLASAGSDAIIYLWTVADSLAEPTPLPGHEEVVTAVAFSPDGQTLASASFDQTIRLWQVSAAPTELATLEGHTARVWSVAFSSDGHSLASASTDGTVRLWEMRDPPAKPIVYDPHQNRVQSVAFSPDGRLFASASDDQDIWLWQLANPAAQPIVLRDHEDVVRVVAFSPDSQTLASAGHDGAIRLWDVTQANPEAVILGNHEGRVLSLAFSPADQTLASAGDDGIIRLWQVANPAATIMLKDHEGSVLYVAFSPSGETLASAGDDGAIRLWDMTQSSPVSTILGKHEGDPLAVAFSPDGQILASAGDDHIIRLWQVANPAAEPVLLQGHESDVLSVLFSHADAGKTLASASYDGTIRLWIVAQPTTEPIILEDHEGGILSLALHPTEPILASAGDDETVRLWIAQTDILAELACERVRRNLTAQEWQQFLGEQPYRRTCPNLPIHPSVIEAARQLARSGKMDRAITQFQYLLTLDPTLNLDPEMAARQAFQEAIQSLLDEGKALAREGQVEQATAKLQQALDLDPGLTLDPAAEAHRLAQPTFEDLIEDGVALAEQGQIEAALTIFADIKVSDASFDIKAEKWHALCVAGSQHGETEAQAVLMACDRAIELDPENGLFHSSRGLVRSMLGDQAGSLEDFKFVREHLQQNEEQQH